MALHIDHSACVLLFLFGEFALQAVELALEGVDLLGEGGDFAAERVDGLLLSSDLVVEDEDGVEALLDVSVEFFGAALLFLALACHVLLLAAQLFFGGFGLLFLLLLGAVAFLLGLGGGGLGGAALTLGWCGEHQCEEGEEQQESLHGDEGCVLGGLFDKGAEDVFGVGLAVFGGCGCVCLPVAVGADVAQAEGE